MRSLLVASLALVGCATFPNAQLVIDSSMHDVVAAPVVCGPMGFRKSPLQSRWGEYVRVTVSSPGALHGTAFVNANGVVGETRAWSTDDGALVIEARFENLDPDARYALRREQPIDVTLSGLVGTCEGAVFTVEQGELVPDIDERAWVAELVRRGGPELAARREAARVEAEARRQAHYAAWEARGPGLVADAAIREAHYAAFSLSREGEGQATIANVGEGTTCAAPSVSTGAVGTSGCATSASGAMVSSAVGSGVGGTSSSGSVGTNGAVSTGCATCGASLSSGSIGMSGAVGTSGAVSSSGSVGVSTNGCATCAVPRGAMGASSSVGMNGSVATSGCATCVVPSGAMADANNWNAYQPSGASGGGGSGGAGGEANAWAAYPAAELQPVPISVEWTAYPPVPPPAPVVVAPGSARDEEVAINVVLPVLFGALFQVAAAPIAAPSPRPSQPAHLAVPLNAASR